jgi:hypothetical protein
MASRLSHQKPDPAARLILRWTGRSEIREILELLVAGVDFGAREGPEAIDPELFAAEAPHD